MSVILRLLDGAACALFNGVVLGVGAALGVATLLSGAGLAMAFIVAVCTPIAVALHWAAAFAAFGINL